METYPLLSLGPLYSGFIEKRPSKHCKTPYVADVLINEESFLGHTASLGCCGLCDKGAEVLCCKIEKKNNKCPYKVLLNKSGDNIIGIDPGLAEQLVNQIFQKNLFGNLKIKSFKTQVKYEKSRFDFAGIDTNDIPFILEVKNVPLVKNNISYFPDGFKKKKDQPVSPRAVKHLNELASLVSENQRCVICYVIQRDDSSGFSPSNDDLIYKEAFVRAVEKGVEVICLVVKWDILGNAYFIRDDLPICIN